MRRLRYYHRVFLDLASAWYAQLAMLPWEFIRDVLITLAALAVLVSLLMADP